MAEGNIVVTITDLAGNQSTVTPTGELVAELETRDQDLGDPRMYKRLEALSFQLEGEVPGGTVSVGYRDRIDDPLTWVGPYPVNQGDNMVFVDLPSARYFRLRFRDSRVVSTWKMSEIEFYGVMDGGRL